MKVKATHVWVGPLLLQFVQTSATQESPRKNRLGEAGWWQSE